LRWRIAILISAAIAISYLDRQTLPVAIKAIGNDIPLTNSRRPGDVHVHFFGTDALSFSDQIRLQDGDIMQVSVEGYGRPLRNRVRVCESKPNLIQAIALG
jgi:hypothetical protein